MKCTGWVELKICHEIGPEIQFVAIAVVLDMICRRDCSHLVWTLQLYNEHVQDIEYF